MIDQRIKIELSSEQFGERFKVLSQMHDPFARSYFIAGDSVTQKRVIYKHYLAETQEQLQAIYDNIENYIKLSQQEGICKILAYTKLVAEEQVLATFQYNDLSLGEYIMTPQFSSNRPIFYITLLQQLTAIIQSMSQIGIDIDQLNYGNILVSNQKADHVEIKVFYDERQKTFQKVLEGVKTFTSLQKLSVLVSGDEGYFNGVLEDGMSAESIYQLGLLLVDMMYKCENDSRMGQDDFLIRDSPVNRSSGQLNEQKSYYRFTDGTIFRNQQYLNQKLTSLRNSPLRVIKELTQLAQLMMEKFQNRIKIYQLPGEIDRILKIYKDASKKTGRLFHVTAIQQQSSNNNNQNIRKQMQKRQSQLSSLSNPMAKKKNEIYKVDTLTLGNNDPSINTSSSFYNHQIVNNFQSSQYQHSTSHYSQSSNQNRIDSSNLQKCNTLANTKQSLGQNVGAVTTTALINEHFNHSSNLTINHPSLQSSKRNEQNNLDVSNQKAPRLIIPKEAILMSLRTHQSIKSSLENLIKQIQNLPGLRKKQYYDNSVYYGGVSNLTNKRTGLGVYLYSTGDIYFGTWLENQLIDGTYIFKNGQSYEGSVKNGKQGWGRYRYSNGNVYEGEWKDDIKHGKGTMLYPNLDKYEGQWVKGKKNGLGKYFYNNGTIYEGNFANGRKQGFGTITFSNGTKIQANWQQTHIQGQGKVTYSNGDLFQGEYCISQKHGKGMYIWGDDNTKYEGDFKKDALEGEARIYFTSKQYYSGRIRNGKRDGQGNYFYENGDSFTGEWKNDMKLIGTYKFKNGEEFQGKFKDNQLNFGVLRYNNGETYEGEFKSGCRNGVGSYRDRFGELICQGHWQNDNLIQANQYQ